ncbi:serine hydrolase BPHL-like isoform X2 [Dermacentor variabilis]|uniref:serine hydrolase BPHL-like isoform X2 n=1 Tax=Dermacentor variabilis TaxID=34621 RepID=UPI003F5B3D94
MLAWKSSPVPYGPKPFDHGLHSDLGSTRTDFAPQLEKLNKQLFTIIAWDPPGYGFSRPPERTFPVDFYHRDARVLAAVLHKLGHKQYFVVGWSDGANTGMILAAMYPERIQKLVAFGGNAFVTEHDVQLLEATRNIDKWSEKMRASMEAMYGTEHFRQLWSRYCDFYQDLLHKNYGEVCRKELPLIRCPTLVVQGGKDPLVPMHHALYLLQHIAKAKLYLVPDGKHNLHFKYADEFNKVVTEFLIS